MLLFFVREKPRMKNRWQQLIARFESFEMPSEDEILMTLDHCKFHLKVLGKSLECLQEAGTEGYESIAFCNEAFLFFG